MDAEVIAAYFAKKIAKEIRFDIRVIGNDGETPVRRFYALEPTAVVGTTLHMLLHLKLQTEHGEKQGRPRLCGEAEIPLQDGDTLSSVFDMAVAGADFGEVSMRIEACAPETERFGKAYLRLQSRLEAEAPSPPGP